MLYYVKYKLHRLDKGRKNDNRFGKGKESDPTNSADALAV